MTALSGEVICRCGEVLLAQDGSCRESERGQVVCVGCRDRYDKVMVMGARNNLASVVMKRCPEGCEERMVKIQSGARGKMKCPQCGVENEFTA